MDAIAKRNILLSCNTLSATNLKALINSGKITLSEFEEAGLEPFLIKQLSVAIEQEQSSTVVESEKTKVLQRIAINRISVDEFITDFNSGKITENDLLNNGLSEKTIRSIKYFGSKGKEVTVFKSIEDLPKMAENRTDVYFVGLPGTGKSTMLAGLLYAAHRDGILLPDTHNNDGAIFQNLIVSELTKGVLPKATAMGSFNYVAMSLADEEKKTHPFNVVEVPGELYKEIYHNNNIADLLGYMKNENKKILIFTIDSLTHDDGYQDGDSLDQSLVYLNILNIFKNNGILNKTDAIYLVANKFDAIKESRYRNDHRPDADLAMEFLSDEFKSLINNCMAAREESKNKFKIKVLPFSIGEVVYTSILKSYRKDYAHELIQNILLDSFVVTKGPWSVFKK